MLPLLAGVGRLEVVEEIGGAGQDSSHRPRLLRLTRGRFERLVRQTYVAAAEVVDDDADQVALLGADARFLDARDQYCRHPRCDAPIPDHDHVTRVGDDGETNRSNGQGLCEAHDIVKELPGWHARVVDARAARHTVEITTPTGHTYRSHAPPGLPPPV